MYADNIEDYEDNSLPYADSETSKRDLKVLLFKKEVTIDTLPHLKCIRLVSISSIHLPFKMH